MFSRYKCTRVSMSTCSQDTNVHEFLCRHVLKIQMYTSFFVDLFCRCTSFFVDMFCRCTSHWRWYARSGQCVLKTHESHGKHIIKMHGFLMLTSQIWSVCSEDARVTDSYKTDVMLLLLLKTVGVVRLQVPDSQPGARVPGYLKLGHHRVQVPFGNQCASLVVQLMKN